MAQKIKLKYWFLSIPIMVELTNWLKEIAKGMEIENNAVPYIKLVKASQNPTLKNLPVATVDELTSYDGIAFGSPVYFGNISTGMSEFYRKPFRCGLITLWKEFLPLFSCQREVEQEKSLLFRPLEQSCCARDGIGI